MATTTMPQSATAAAAVPATVARRAPRRKRGNAVASVAAVAFAGIWLFPVYWMVNSAFLTTEDLQSATPTWFPLQGTVEHFSAVLASDEFWSAFRMSASIAAIVVVGALVLGFVAALALSRFRFRSRTTLIVSILIIQMIPAETVFVSQYRMLDSWQMLNSVAGASLIYLGSSVPFTIWLLKGFVDGVPIELEEAAQIDGCSRLGAFLRITLPLLGSGLVASAIFAFLASWNEYTLALVTLTSSDSVTLPLWLTTFSGQNQDTNWGGIMAGSTLMALPVVILFLAVQRHMASGLTAGAVK